MDEKSLIMVVDDDITLLDIAEEVLCGVYDVTLAQSGRQALEIMCGGLVPELILLDVDMPDLNGYETLRSIRAAPELMDVPVIFLTGVAGSYAELEGLKLGAQDYITKPFARENLLERIRLRLEDGRHARELKELSRRLTEANADEERFLDMTSGLTNTERDVAALIAQGFGNLEIAKRLNYSPGYVKNLATVIYEKLDVRGRGELRELLRSR